MRAVAEYEARKDERGRVTLKGADFDLYHVVAYDDGHFEVHPRIVVDPALDRRTLVMMDAAVRNLRRGKAGRKMNPADLVGGERSDD